MKARNQLEWDKAAEIIPDYGSDTVLARVVMDHPDGIDIRTFVNDNRVLNPGWNRALATLSAVRIALDCMGVLETLPEESRPVFWRSSSGFPWMTHADDKIAKDALQTVRRLRYSSVLYRVPQFHEDLFSIAGELIRYKRRDWLGHNRKDTNNWGQSNPLALFMFDAIQTQVLRRGHTRQISTCDPPDMPPEVRATRFIYEID